MSGRIAQYIYLVQEAKNSPTEPVSIPWVMVNCSLPGHGVNLTTIGVGRCSDSGSGVGSASADEAKIVWASAPVTSGQWADTSDGERTEEQSEKHLPSGQTGMAACLHPSSQYPRLM